MTTSPETADPTSTDATNTAEVDEPQYPVHPADLARGERPTKNFYISCSTHCCVNPSHGCKYGFKGCPVKTGQVVQEYPCEQCGWEIDNALRYEHGYAKPGEIGHRVVFGLKRENSDGRGEMADMPTTAQVNAAVAEALAGLTINGWALTRVLGDVTDDDSSTDDDDDED